MQESEDNNSNGNDDEKGSSDETVKETVEETEAKDSEQAEETKASDDEQASETKSSLRVVKEDVEETEKTVKDQDNKSSTGSTVWDFKTAKYTTPDGTETSMTQQEYQDGEHYGLTIALNGGKFQIRSNGDVLINEKTVIKIPLTGKSTITIVNNSGFNNFTLDGDPPTNTVNKTDTFICTGNKGYAELVGATGKQTYLYSITVQPFPTAEVSGSVTATPAISDSYQVVFTEKTDSAKKVIVKADVTSGSYTAALCAGTYTVSLSDESYSIDTGAEITVAESDTQKTHDITASKLSTTEVTGNIQFPQGITAPDDLKLIFTEKDAGESAHKPTVTIAESGYTVSLKAGTDYAVTAEGTGVNDYTLSPDTISTASGSKDITFTEKTKYPVTLTITSFDDGLDLSEKEITFTNVNEEGYSYPFTGTENISLRNGTYSVSMDVEYPYMFDFSQEFQVQGQAKTITLNFTERMAWDFTNTNDVMLKSRSAQITANQTEEQDNNGLKIITSGGSFRFDGSQVQIANGNIVKIPVSGKGTIQVVTAGTNYTYYTITGEPPASAADASYDYDVTGEEGEKGYVTLTSTNNNLYIRKIIVTRETQQGGGDDEEVDENNNFKVWLDDKDMTDSNGMVAARAYEYQGGTVTLIGNKDSNGEIQFTVYDSAKDAERDGEKHNGYKAGNRHASANDIKSIPNAGDGCCVVFEAKATGMFKIYFWSTSFLRVWDFETASGKRNETTPYTDSKTAADFYAFNVVPGHTYVMSTTGSTNNMAYIGYQFIQNMSIEVETALNNVDAEAGALDALELTLTDTVLGTKKAVVKKDTQKITLLKNHTYKIISNDGSVRAEVGGKDTFTVTSGDKITFDLYNVSSETLTGEITGTAEGTVTSLKFVNMVNGSEFSADITGTTYSCTIKPGEYNTVVETTNGGKTYDRVSVKVGAENVNEVYVEVPDTSSPVVAFKSELNVPGDYDTLNKAFDAIASMEDRPEGEAGRVTVNLNKDLREQTVLNAPYVTLKGNNHTVDWYYGVKTLYYSIDPSTGLYSERLARDKYSSTEGNGNLWGGVFIVRGSNFIAEDTTFKNTYNYELTNEEKTDIAGSTLSVSRLADGADVAASAYKERSNAFYIEADKIECYNCKILSSQDTLGRNGSANNNYHVYFKDCVIGGNVDYVCGEFAAVFDNCELQWKTLSDKGNDKVGYIVAPKTSPNVFRNCTVTTDKEVTGVLGFYGRTWGKKSNASFINTETNGYIIADGWALMNDEEGTTAIFKEYGNTSGGKAFTTTGSYCPAANQTLDAVKDYIDTDTVSITETVLGGWTPSHYSYEPDKKDPPAAKTVAEPAANIPEGEIPAGSTVTLTSTTEGAAIYYTTDGSEPSAENGTLYEAPIVVDKDMTIKAIAVKDGMNDSPITSYTYTTIDVDPEKYVYAPAPSIGSGTVTSGTKVTLTSMTEGAAIYYTIDGTEPSAENGTLYEAPITIDKTVTIKAVAVKGENASSVSTFEYTVSDTAPGGDDKTVGAVKASPDSGTVRQNTTVSLTCETADAVIYYTTDGTDPTKESTLYTAPISLGDTEGTVTIKAFAAKEGMTDSAAAAFVYTISADAPGQVEAPEADPKPGTYAKGTTVKLTSTTEGAAIYYTLDGTNPTKESTLYDKEKPVSLGDAEGTVTIKAVAVKEGWIDSALSTFEYTVSAEAGGEAGDTEEPKITVDTDAPDGKISVRNAAKIKIEAADLVENGKVQYAVTVTYTHNGKQQQLTEGVHYNVTLVKGGSDGKSAGEQKVNIVGTDAPTDLGTFKDAKTVSYKIIEKTSADRTHDISKARLTLKDAKNLTYTGTYITPEVEGLDSSNYSVVYKNNVNVGKASVTVIGKNGYFGTKTLTFSIKKADLSKQALTITAGNAAISGNEKSYTAGEFTYSGKPITLTKLAVKMGSVTLSPRADYTVSYKKNAQKGKATATIKGVNNLSGAVSITFDIKTVDVAAELNKLTEPLPAEYASKGARLSTITVNGVTLKEGTDYKVNYKGCSAKELDEPGTVAVTGAGSYKDASFKNVSVNIKVGKGTYHIKDNTVVDTAKTKNDPAKTINAAKITDASGVKVKPEEVDVVTANDAIKVTPKDTAHYEEAVLSCRVAAKLGSVKPADKKAKIADKYFDGVNAVTVTETEIEKAGVLGSVKADEIRIVSYKNNNKAGTATVTVEGRSTGPYYGTKSLKFKIVSLKAALKDATEEQPETEESSSTPGTGDDPGKDPGTEDPGTNPTEPDTETEPNTEEETVTEPNTSEDPGSDEPATDSEAREHTIWVVGDSTVCSYIDANGNHKDKTYYYPRYGYGTQIRNYETGYYTVNNIAMSGRSSKDFVLESGYTTLKDGIKEGDVLIIGFGHNDEKEEPERYTNANGTYETEGSFAKSLYDNYVKIALDAKAQPILCTPIVRRNKNSDTLSNDNCHITTDKEKDGVSYPGGDYPQAIRDLGAAVNVPVVDLTALTKAHYEKIGKDETLYLHAWTNSTTADNTHLNIYGAKVVAHMLATELKKLTDLEISKHITNVKNAPNKDADLVVNPDYKDSTGSDYTPPTQDSALWKNYGIFKGSAFGAIGGNPTKTNFTLEADADKNMHIKVGSDKGKIDSSVDGIAMYYYQIPADSKFTLSATAKINTITDEKGQAAFGLMARDDMYIDLRNDALCSDYVAAGTTGKGSVNCFYRKSGNLAKPSLLGADVQAGQTYNLEISFNGDGYACKLGDNERQSDGYDFTLTSIDKEYQYIGMFVARNADITFSNIELTVDGSPVAIGEIEAGEETPPAPAEDLSIGGEGGDVTIPAEVGLKAGNTYGYSSVATFEVLEDMPWVMKDGELQKFTFEGVDYSFVQGATSGPSSVTIPEKGKAAFKITALVDSEITFTLKVSAGKTYYYVDGTDASNVTEVISNESFPSGTDITSFKRTIPMKAGGTYYFYAGGSKVMVGTISIAKTAAAE